MNAMNNRTERLTMPLELSTKPSDTHVGEREVTPVATLGSNFNKLDTYGEIITTMGIEELRDQFNQLTALVLEFEKEIPQGEGLTLWDQERKRLLELTQEKLKLIEKRLNAITSEN